MRVTFILSLFREDIVRALFWTLVHSLWQGLALAMLTGLVILLTRRSAPVLRYNILLGLFCLFMAAAGTTFILQLRGAGSEGAGPVQTNISSTVEAPLVSGLLTPGELSWSDKLVGYFNQQAELIVAVWMIILGIRLVKLLVNLGNVQRLRYYRASVVEDKWQERVSELAQRIGIKKVVVMLESAVIGVPMMAGIFRPVILVPLGFLSQLPPQQVEAILLHELAHIRRKDYVINLLQSIAEILLFFNPAVLWISSLIREERENCCDDIAVGETRNKKEFIHALVSFQEYAQSSSYALAFPGSKNQLLGRVQRIVHQEDKRLNGREKFFLLVCVLITAGVIIAYGQKAPETARKMVVQEITVQALPVGVPEIAAMSVGRDTSKPVEAGKPARSVKEQQAALAEQQKRLEEAEMRLAVQEKELAAQQERLNDLYADALARAEELRDSVHERGEVRKVELMREMQQERKLRLDRRMEESMARQQEAEVRKAKLELDKLQLTAKMTLRKDQRQMESQLRLARTAYLRDASAERRNKYIDPIIGMLLDRKIIHQQEELSFSLDKDGFTVNGQLQPDEVFQSFREAFLHDPQDYIRYSKKGKTESTTISKRSN